MSTVQLNNSPTKYQTNGVCIQVPYDFDELKKRKKNENSDSYTLKLKSNSPYKIKQGDILFRRNGKVGVFATLNNINIDGKTRENILDELTFAGFAYKDFDPKLEKDLPMLAFGVQRVSSKGSSFLPQDKLELYLPDFKNGGITEYSKLYADGRITLGVKRVDESDETSVLGHLMQNMSITEEKVDIIKTFNGQDESISRSDVIKNNTRVSDIMKMGCFFKWAIKYGIIDSNTLKKLIDSSATLNVISGFNEDSTNELVVALTGMLGFKNGYKNQNEKLWDMIYGAKKTGNPFSKYINSKGSPGWNVLNSPSTSLFNIYQELARKKNRSFATVLSHDNLGLQMKINDNSG